MATGVPKMKKARLTLRRDGQYTGRRRSKGLSFSVELCYNKPYKTNGRAVLPWKTGGTQMANRVTVTIRSHNYHVLAEEEESYIRQCADLVSRELDRAMDGTTLSMDDGAVLAALNLADQYFKERQVSDNLRAQLKEALDENARIRRQSSQKKAARSGGKKAAAPREPEEVPAIPAEIPAELPAEAPAKVPAAAPTEEPEQTRLPIPEAADRET